MTNIAWRTASGARLGGFAYRYDAVGRIVSRRHSLGGVSFDRDYAYDGMDRLASDGDTAYSYDVAELRAVRYRFQGRERSAATGGALSTQIKALNEVLGPLESGGLESEDPGNVLKDGEDKIRKGGAAIDDALNQ